MIIQIEGATTEKVEAAKRGLDALAHSWGHEIAEDPAEATTAARVTYDDKLIDPVSVAALVLSIPSAATAVLDLADRIRKRRRANELIDQAQQQASQQVTISLISQSRTIELRTLNPDQLLDLLADEDLTT